MIYYDVYNFIKHEVEEGISVSMLQLDKFSVDPPPIPNFIEIHSVVLELKHADTASPI
jgi:hypothetical protein